jgi:RimJ/RimL family protein N-acetyltransferase
MEAFWAFYQSGRAKFMDRPKSKTHLWYGFASEVGSWDLLGYGAWALEVEGELAGQVAITHPPHFPEREIGWILFDGFEGRGFAQEAATLALHWAWEQGFENLVSYIEKDNARSVALARRLGAQHDPHAQTYDDADVVYRHVPDTDGNPEAYA